MKAVATLREHGGAYLSPPQLQSAVASCESRPQLPHGCGLFFPLCGALRMTALLPLPQPSFASFFVVNRPPPRPGSSLFPPFPFSHAGSARRRPLPQSDHPSRAPQVAHFFLLSASLLSRPPPALSFPFPSASHHPPPSHPIAPPCGSSAVATPRARTSVVGVGCPWDEHARTTQPVAFL